MAENKEKNDKSDDVIAREDYNKVVEAHNSAKVELEKLQKELLLAGDHLRSLWAINPDFLLTP